MKANAQRVVNVFNKTKDEYSKYLKIDIYGHDVVKRRQFLNFTTPSTMCKMPSRHLTSVGRQIDVRLRRHNDVGFRLILKVCLTSKTDVILTSEKQRWFDVSNVTS